MPTPLLTLGELTERLSTLPLVRRRAILFALDANVPITSVVELTWKKLTKIQPTPLALRLAHSMPRHIRLEYVFWEELPNHIASPLFALADDLLTVSRGLGFQKFQKQYENMILINDEADLDHMIDTFSNLKQATLHLPSLQ